VNGVVHVGAHRGEEVPGYLAEGRSPILCFEPQTLDWTPPAGITLVPLALGDHRGTLTMRVPHHLHTEEYQDTQSASGLILIPERARAIGWTPTVVDEIHVPMVRFDDWARQNGFVSQPWPFSLLAIDVQGMELEVLEGFGEFLASFEDVKVECSEPALYERGSSASEVILFLNSKGFSQSTPILAHGDIYFSKL
jgi:FkbM family methyltransferase